ncbi:MAG TPA: monofunctional biosynthetic peptidoglycan transglycosylase [Chitinophagaceae bacterium]|jgi:monofunctional biosynthetic peptidoglycan transglycosylase|nr:monofunctional biosynthetic peptidoglycan transglycosylase [Chitinophagaceae bacterium]
MKTKGLVPRLLRKLKRILLILFIAQFVYIILLKWMDPPVTLTQLGSWISGHGLKRDYVDKSAMAPAAKLAVIAAEDQLFPDHNGFDFKSIEKAMKHNQKSQSLHGASTISQQVAKNVFLWQGRSWIRKGFEVYFTFMIEQIWGKKRILEVYLNVIQMGDGVFGIEAAAKHYFNKSAANLSRQESAMIAACLPNPVRYTVKPLSSYVANRSGWIMRQMNNLDNDPDIRDLIYNKPSAKK